VSREPIAVARAAEVRRRIETAFAQLDCALIAAGPRVAERAPSVSPWSPLDVGEHVTLANRYLLMLAEKCARKSVAKLARGEARCATDPDLEQLDHIARREFRWDAPEHMLPTGAAGPDEVRTVLSKQRAEALALLDSVSPAAAKLRTIRMTILSPDSRLDLHEFLTFIALHAERHAAQAQLLIAALDAGGN
jgi:hypothetical protein